VISALKYEWRRITTIRSSYWMSGMAVALSAGVTMILILVVNEANSQGDLGDLAGVGVYTTWMVTAGGSSIAMPIVGAMFFAVMGAMAMGHEYRYGTNKATLTAIPDRIAVLAAKAAVLSAWVAVAAAISLLLNAVLAWLFVGSTSIDTEALRPFLMYVLYCVGFGLAGFGLSSIFRNQVGAIVTVLIWPLVLEPIIFAVLRATALANADIGLGKIANLLPASAGRRTMFRPYELWSNLDTSDRAHIWSLAPSVLVFWCGIAALVVAGSVLFVKRDA
jgi:ABC-type transport system involved in multi-copper enzyme maturation permease subunit